jgi:hypothetical protein
VQELKQSGQMISTKEGMEIDLNEGQFTNAVLSIFACFDPAPNDIIERKNQPMHILAQLSRRDL